MAENNFSGVIESLMKGMNGVLSTKTVVGEATQVGDTIILPLVDVSFGVGAGANTADKKPERTTCVCNSRVLTVTQATVSRERVNKWYFLRANCIK